jgi:hypothetical protein
VRVLAGALLDGLLEAVIERCVRPWRVLQMVTREMPYELASWTIVGAWRPT